MISVVIPCHNSEAFVGRAIDSVLKQTYREYEIILVDNNSTDGTLAVLQDYQRRYPGLIEVLEEPQKGAPAARNKGLFLAKGEWIQFLDSDDELLPDKLEHQLALTRNAPYDVIGGSYYNVKETSTERTAVPVESKDIWKGLLTSRLGITSANLWRREALLAVNGWNETMTASSDEYELMFRILKNSGHIGVCTEPLCLVYRRETSLSRSTNYERTCEILNNGIKLRFAIKEYLKAKGKLTKELNREADMLIYARLMKYRQQVPDYVKTKLQELKLDIPFAFVLKSFIKPRVKKILTSVTRTARV